MIRWLRSILPRAGSGLTTYEGLLQASNRFHTAPAPFEPGNENVLVLAPHMDDEVIGCGGTVALHADAGADVTVAYLTDGRFGHPEVYTTSGAEREQAQARLMPRRKNEARLAQDVLGIMRICFLDAVDTQLGNDPNAARRLAELLHEIRPVRVYVPHFLEQHPDHRAASAQLIRAARVYSTDFEVVGYEVWTPLVPNRLVQIDASMERKQRAMALYTSQLEDRNDLLHAMIGLSSFRGARQGASYEAASRGGFAETFCALPIAEYIEAYYAFMAPLPG